MKELAIELNEILKDSVAYDFLSATGKRIYFPKGIVAQAAEAGGKAKRYNATVGLATDHGEPFCLTDIYSQFKEGSLKKAEIFSYAPGGGDKTLRAVWKEQMIKKNPTLQGKKTSGCTVTGGLTHSIACIGMLFVGEGDEVVCPDLYWDNYQLIFEDLYGAEMRCFKSFKNGGFNVEGMKEALLATKGNTARIILNFPNNPTGYTPSKEEAKAIVEAVKSVADTGKKVMVISDDAYFGLFYEEETEKESLFSYFADAHENIFAIKGDAATKEEMVWGFRIGFLTYASKNFTDAHLDALEKKTLGAVRCSVSNCDRPGQSLLLKALQSGANYQKDKDRLVEVVGERYRIIKKTLEKYKDSKVLQPYPYNSGYFMAFDTMGRSAEELRVYLLEKYQIGAINILGHTFRLAYCSVEKENLEDLVDMVYKAAEELWS
ncbi:MAG: aminotransferase class I/II-fold pyridoxal phosphate-dependent enzyme [Spirochaetales bacterium]|nr:aminotransferase class I/II-fold pyridoxal phosphate-dependent enzyme [Candidatus Physcosoma equi]